jgi:PD-(D/E)XK nuclease superfamily protein
VLTTNQKGAIAETAITAHAIRLGVGVLRPVSDGSRYDLAFDVDGRLLRVQCKWATRRADVVVVRCYTSRRGPSGEIRTSYSERDIDLLAAYCLELDRCYVLPAAMVADRRTFHLRLGVPRNGQRIAILWAAQFELGAIAQLGERLHGMQEVAGSSPASSTR